MKKKIMSGILVCMLGVAPLAAAQAAGFGPSHNRQASPRRVQASPPGHNRQAPPRRVHAPPPNRNRHAPPPRAYAPRHRPPAHRPPPAPHGYNRYKFANVRHTPHGNIFTGHAIPAYYYNNRSNYVIHDWRGRGLYEPPHGHYWLAVDGNFVLAAVATGIVAHILLSH